MKDNNSDSMNRISSKELLDYEYSRLLAEQTAYASFCADLGHCERLQITIGTNKYLFLLTKALPILVNYTGATASPLYNGCDWDAPNNIGIIQNVDDWRTLYEYFKSLYVDNVGRPINTFFTLTGGYTSCVLNLNASTLNQRDLWKTYKHILYPVYSNDDSLPMYSQYVSGVTYDGGASQAEAFNPAGNSLATWAEMPGIYTAYIDNVGVFLPVGMPIDAEMTSQIELTKPKAMEYVYVKLNPNAGESQSLSVAQTFAGSIPFAGLFTGAIVTGQQSRRFLLPRLRAFGRQETPAPTYQQYVQDCRSLGATVVSGSAVDWVGGIKDSLAWFDEPTYEGFVGKLESYNVIPRRTEASTENDVLDEYRYDMQSQMTHPDQYHPGLGRPRGMKNVRKSTSGYKTTRNRGSYR